jgi:hypothetical protein
MLAGRPRNREPSSATCSARRPRGGPIGRTGVASRGGLALGWTLYLMAAAIVSFGPSMANLAASPTAYRPAAVRLAVLVAMGLFVLWPVVRLCQAWAGRPLRAALVDLFVLVVPALVLVWPQVLLAGWPGEVALAVSMWLLAWATISAGVVALAAPVRPRTDRRDAAVRAGVSVVWLGLVVGVPLWGLLFARGMMLGADRHAAFGGWAWMLSPVSGVFEMARDRSWSGQPAQVAGDHWRAMWIASSLAAATLIVAVARRAGAGRVDPA